MILWLVLFACGMVGSSDKPDPQRGTSPPNVLIVVWDTVRADHTTPYGYELDTTPRLAELAKTGVVYERAVSPGMWTVPSHASMFTGLPVSAHGANATHKWLDKRFMTMAEWFGEHGYGTYLFAANPWVGRDTNLAQGFDTVEAPWDKKYKARLRKLTEDKLIPSDASNVLGPQFVQGRIRASGGYDRTKDAGKVTAKALQRWLRDSSDRPFFAVLNYMEAHVPRIPSMAARRALFDKETIKRQLSTDQSVPELLAYTLNAKDFSDRRIEAIRGTYDASLRELDTSTGLLWDMLKDEGLLDNTIVVVTSDHGEHLGEHHLLDHKYSLYNPLVRVPLIIRYPPGLSAGRVEQVVSNLGIFPTVAELAGFEPPESVHGTSLTRLEEQPEEAYSELVAITSAALTRIGKYYDIDKKAFKHVYAAVEGSDRKCIERDDGHRQLYAVTDDPLESKDLAPSESPALCERIETWRSSFEAYDSKKRSKTDAASAGAAESRMKDRLEMLGYLE